ncbi:MAG: metallophosphoesterase [Candidatus Paceibacterota bacterium]
MNSDNINPLHLTPEYSFVDLGDHDYIGVAGDWHGDLLTATQVLYRAANEGVSIIFQLGDFGLMPGERGKKFLSGIDAVAQSTGVTIYWLDGNHEDFDRLERRRRKEEALTYFTDNVIHLGRGSRWSFKGVRFCAVGGAVSLDRKSRIPNVSWWRQEELTELQVSDIANGGGCDVLFTHDLTHEVDVPGIVHGEYVPQWDREELRRAWSHRERLGALTAMLKPTHMYHGHFHVAYAKEVNTSFGVAKARGLADNFNANGNIEFLSTSVLREEVLDVRSRRVG